MSAIVASRRYRCKRCRRTLRETWMSKAGLGLVIQLRCPGCRAVFYAARAIPARLAAQQGKGSE